MRVSVRLFGPGSVQAAEVFFDQHVNAGPGRGLDAHHVRLDPFLNDPGRDRHADRAAIERRQKGAGVPPVLQSVGPDESALYEAPKESLDLQRSAAQEAVRALQAGESVGQVFEIVRPLARDSPPQPQTKGKRRHSRQLHPGDLVLLGAAGDQEEFCHCWGEQ